MTSEPVNLSPDARERVDAYLDTIERVLVAADMSRPERRGVIDDVEAQILDMLATCAGTEAAIEDVEAVLSDLDPPEAYAEAGGIPPGPPVSVSPAAPPCRSEPTRPPQPKSKTTSVLLAVFLSFFSWLYTWRKDWPQFVVGATLHCVVAPVLFVLGAFVEVGSSGLQATLICVAILLKLVVWIAAIIDAAVTPSGWYANYPNVGWWGWDYPE